MRDKVMSLVRKICSMEQTNCRSLNKSSLARELLNIANVPQNAEIQEIPLDWNNQVVILFLIPGDVIYYSLFAGIGRDGNFYFELTVTGVLNGNQFEFISDEISLDLDYFKTADENAKKEIEKEVYARIQAEIDDIQETNDSLLAWIYSGI